MHKFLATVAVFAMLSSTAIANDWTPEERTAGLQKYDFSRFVPSSVKRTLETAYALNPDCTSSGPIEIRKIQEPEHGTVEFPTADVFPTYGHDTKFAKCNEKKTTAVLINYKSADGYVGPDTFGVLVMYANGMAREVHYKMIVR
jgi:hypothetical protein